MFHSLLRTLSCKARFFKALLDATATMTEDDIYRASTQFRLWSFTKSSLASLRSTTNSLAADRVRAAIRRLHSATIDETAVDTIDNDHNREVECLSVEEEQKLVAFYCVRAMDLADHCDFPTNVKVCSSSRVSFIDFGIILTRCQRLPPCNFSSASTCPTRQ